jgi:hypothetical protein
MYNLFRTKESSGWTNAQARSKQDAQVQRRLQMPLRLKGRNAKSRSAAADRLGACRNTTVRNTIANRLELYKTGGIHKLCEIQGSG